MLDNDFDIMLKAVRMCGSTLSDNGIDIEGNTACQQWDIYPADIFAGEGGAYTG